MERERSRLARELHSGAGQSLAGIKLNLEMLATSQDILSAPARKFMDRLERLTEQALQQVRSVSHSLHPPDWQGLSLYTALRALVETSGLAERVAVEFIVSEFPVEPVHDIKIAIYRCAQECIANIIKHSAATRVSFRVELEGPFIVMRIRDNGCGFEVENPFSDKLNRGIGLIALKEYAEVADGILDVKSDSAGTTVVLSVALLSTVTMEE